MIMYLYIYCLYIFLRQSIKIANQVFTIFK